MSLIGILFGIVFVTLLLKAICETIWGLLLIGHGVVCHTIAAILNLIASTLRLWKRITKSKKNAQARTQAHHDTRRRPRAHLRPLL